MTVDQCTAGIPEAVDILAARLSAASGERSEVEAEIQVLVAAIRKLAPLAELSTCSPQRKEPRASSPPHLSIRQAVRRVLDDTPRPLTPAEVTSAIAPQFGHASNLTDVVRNALWSLRQSGIAVRVGARQTISTIWTTDHGKDGT